MTPAPSPTVETLAVLPAEAFVVVWGVARGEALGIADDLVPDDLYRLVPDAAPRKLRVALDAAGRMTVAPGSETGQTGHAVHLDCALTLAAADGRLWEMLVLVEVENDAVAAIHALPLAGAEPGSEHRLVGIDRHAATARLAELASASFARGTRIALASGAQVPVEDLRPGDRVLTRDDGPQPLRWIGCRTVRATGAFAPVVIRAGALHNAGDLVLAPDHRIFVWQREDRLGAGRAEVLVRVRHLVNGDSVQIREGGFVDYFQLLFDDHQIVFAEGIAAESLLVDLRTCAGLPMGARPHGPRRHLAYEVAENLLPGADMAELLRRASSAR
ncbi:Hint domain-containing protein [Rubellimicrobium sp. CFH 75288]|uniref:Hint domain-containing protein n=1 Tax=Rubellimicrobium sp. CFH 75288 TaxID=2697034 RepID=UPI0014125573|nr:Hint domain-containing protein [Rubellimicrobium sp. CFH 75288]NAZ36413.1 hypothetical protein [Rubellimicrobium sp. CFH 75288]